MKRISFTVDGCEMSAYEFEENLDTDDVMVSIAVVVGKYIGKSRGYRIKAVGPKCADLVFRVFSERFCERFGLDWILFMGRHNKRPYPEHRAIFYMVWRDHLREGLKGLAARFGRHHSSLVVAVQDLQGLIEKNKKMRMDIAAAMLMLSAVMDKVCIPETMKS